MPRISLALIALCALCCATASSSAAAAVALFTVGADAACDYRTDVLSNALQSAINDVPLVVPETDLYVIHVARSGNYDGAQLIIDGRGMLIEGGYSTCDDFTVDSTNTVIDSMAMNVGAVMQIDGETSRETVTLSHLTLSGGNGSGGRGLVIRNADVRLNNVSLSNNHGAIRGGGLFIQGIEHGASVEIYGQTSITSNSVTQDGGGIRCERGARLAIHSDSGISSNSAGFSGGGISVNGCSGYINSGGSGLAALFFNVGFNDAHDGAGIALESTLGPTNIVIGEGLGASDPRPVITQNQAIVQGGGIFAVDEGTILTVRNAVIVSNSAASLGGGVMVRNGATALITRTLASCDGSTDCSVIASNSAAFGGGIAAAGDQVDVTLAGTLVNDNSASVAGSALSVTSGAHVAVTDSFLVENDGFSVVEVSSISSSPPRAASVYLAASTIAGNTGLTSVVDVNDEGSATFNRMIVNADAAVPSVSKSAGNADPTYLCSIFHESASITGQDPNTSFRAIPGFINAASGNYHLAAYAWAIDQCPEDLFLLPTDYDLDARPINSPLSDLAGPFDVGADEWTGAIFADGLED